jgi:hypothetical protein
MERPDPAVGNAGRLRGLNRKDALRQAQALSELHLSLASEEFWDRWENVAARKADLYQTIGGCNGGPMDLEERAMAVRILDLERRMIALLEGKRKQDAEVLAAHPPDSFLSTVGKPAASQPGRVLRVAC